MGKVLKTKSQCHPRPDSEGQMVLCIMNLRRRSRPKPWLAKKKGRNTRNLKTGELVKPFQGSGVSSSFYQSPQWKATSYAVLERDAVCQWCLRLGRIREATQADHVVPVHRCLSEGINEYDKTNIVGSCASCNAKRAAYEARGVIFKDFDDCVKYMQKKELEKNE